MKNHSLTKALLGVGIFLFNLDGNSFAAVLQVATPAVQTNHAQGQLQQLKQRLTQINNQKTQVTNLLNNLKQKQQAIMANPKLGPQQRQNHLAPVNAQIKQLQTQQVNFQAQITKITQDIAAVNRDIAATQKPVTPGLRPIIPQKPLHG